MPFDIAGRFSPMLNNAATAISSVANSPVSRFGTATQLAPNFSAAFANMPKDDPGAPRAPATPNPNNPNPSVPTGPQAQQVNNPNPAVPTSAPTPTQQPILRTQQPQQQQMQYQQMYQPQQQMYQPQQQMYQQQMYQPQMQQQQGMAPTQMAGRGNAQSVSNYLQALQQAGAAGNNRAMMTPGQLGAPAQAGFRGFGQNGSYGPQYVPTNVGGPSFFNPQVYGGAGVNYNNNLAFAGPNYSANNAAYAGPNYSVGNSAYQGNYGTARAPQTTGGGVTAGGTGGVAGQPTWETPKPWLNMTDPQDNPDLWNSMSSDEKSAYLGAPREGGWGEDKPPQSYGQHQQGSFYSTSDERAKTNIAPAQSELEEFMDALGIYSYEYKDKADGEGRYISPMAQEFEKSQLGRQAVVETPEGKKMVNYGRLMGVQTAALALLNHKYNTLEKKFNESMKTNLKNRKKTNG